jgi:hypothetical protein
MKKLIVLSLTVLLFSCSQLDEVKNSLPSMQANIDNIEWNSATRVTTLMNENFTITGTALNGQIIIINVFGDQEGVYNLNTESVKCAAVFKESATTSTDDAYAAVSGKVEITEVNTSKKKISGSFEFNLRKGTDLQSAKTITNGTFSNLKYTTGLSE